MLWQLLPLIIKDQTAQHKTAAKPSCVIEIVFYEDYSNRVVYFEGIDGILELSVIIIYTHLLTIYVQYICKKNCMRYKNKCVK